MQKVRVPLTNFKFGEVSPSLYSRTDTELYNQSGQRVENFFLRAEGGAIKRPGLEHVYKFADITYNAGKVQQSRLIPFIFSDDEQYIVSLEHQKVRVFLLSPTTGVVSLVSTLTSDVNSATLKFDHDFLHEYTFAQAGDVMFICHPLFVPQQLIRTGLSSFQVEPFIFSQRADAKKVYQPFYSFQKSGTTLNPSAISGSGVTLVTSQAYWDTTGSQSGGNYPNSKHIGTTVRYNGAEIEIVSVQSATSATGDILDELVVFLDVAPFRTSEGSADVEVTMVNHGLDVNDSIVISDAGTVGGITNSNLNGTRSVIEIIDDDRFMFTAAANATSSEDGGGTPKIKSHAPITTWDEQSFSALRGFPAAVTFFENRLVFAGTTSQPDSVFMSKSGKYYNFDVGDASDNDAIQVTASIGEINQIRHLVSNRDLQIFTASSEMYVPAFQNQPVTPTNIQIRRQTPYGCGFERPVVFDGSTVFTQRGGSIVREFIYSDSEAAYVASPISSVSSHLIKTPIEQNVFNGAIDRSESYVFITNADGTLAVFNSNRAENRAGWTEFTCNGTFVSTCTIDNRVFANVVFDLGAGTERIVLCEFVSSKNTDMSTVFSGTAGVFNVSSDFDNGAVVQVVDGNDYIGEFTVAGGQVDVSSVKSLSSAEIGFNFNVTLKTNPIDINAGSGPVTGIPRGIGSVIVDLNNTLSCSVNGTKLIIRNVTDDMSQQQIAFTGKKEFRLLGYNRDPQVTITQTAPLPIQVNGLVAELIF